MVSPVLALHWYTNLTGFLFDLICLAVLVLNVWLGFRYGVLRRLVALVGAYLGVLAASASGNQFAKTFHGTDSDVTVNAWIFTAVFVLLVLVFEFLGALWNERLHKLAELVLDRTIGTALGVVVTLFELGVLAMVAVAVAGTSPAVGRVTPADPTGTQQNLDNSLLGGLVLKIEPAVEHAAAPALPGGGLAQHFEGSTSP